MSSPGRPLITANQVTLARLIPMPLLSWLIYRGAERGYQGNSYMWSALIAGTLIGCTDWIDGLLARKYGPTVLGGLLDPIADKVFIVVRLHAVRRRHPRPARPRAGVGVRADVRRASCSSPRCARRTSSATSR